MAENVGTTTHLPTAPVETDLGCILKGPRGSGPYNQLGVTMLNESSCMQKKAWKETDKPQKERALLHFSSATTSAGRALGEPSAGCVLCRVRGRQIPKMAAVPLFTGGALLHCHRKGSIDTT